MKELRADINRNADYFRMELENKRMNAEKIENSFVEMLTEPKAPKSRLNNAEERISDLEDKIMEITQSGQQTENQMKQSMKNTTPRRKRKRELKIYLKKLCQKTFQI